MPSYYISDLIGLGGELDIKVLESDSNLQSSS